MGTFYSFFAYYPPPIGFPLRGSIGPELFLKLDVDIGNEEDFEFPPLGAKGLLVFLVGFSSSSSLPSSIPRPEVL